MVSCVYACTVGMALRTSPAIADASATRSCESRDNLRTRRPKGFPHSAWDLVEHIRLAQYDLLDFLRNPRYRHALKWPDDYWPKKNAKPTGRQWNASLAQIRRDTKAIARFTTGFRGDLSKRIPHGTGQTFLRTVLVAVVHNSYHTAQIVDVRRLLGAWPGAK